MSDPNFLLRDEPSCVAAADALMSVFGYRRVIDFRDYAAAAKYAIQINEGCNAGLIGVTKNPYAEATTEADAWEYGYAQAHRNLKGQR